jgi:hypothetical protein
VSAAGFSGDPGWFAAAKEAVAVIVMIEEQGSSLFARGNRPGWTSWGNEALAVAAE